MSPGSAKQAATLSIAAYKGSFTFTNKNYSPTVTPLTITISFASTGLLTIRLASSSFIPPTIGDTSEATRGTR
eukprot:m.150633 g.150633  ORF g.150633 m.150633 type:complete len:73 (-) comp15027_c0_seq3:296-514(-)